MSQENVEVVRGIYEGWARGELPWSGGALEAYDPDVEYAMPAPGLIAHGRHEVVRLWRRYLGTWDTYRIELDEIRAVGDDQILVFASEDMRGRGAGVDTESHHGAVWTLKNCRVVRYQSYSDRADALDAVGLRE
jgi:ketosteroid isomerase-like protein